MGYLTANGELDTCIVIRSATVTNGVAHVRAGCGVVHDSIPEAEADETRNKAAAVFARPRRRAVNVLFVDNFDSFTYNLVDELQKRHAKVEVRRNDQPVADLLAVAQRLAPPRMVVLSPGPGAPADAGACIPLSRALADAGVPLLGVCLGHQAIVEAFGGTVGFAGEVVHGKAATVTHTGAPPFAALPNPLRVGRYHSLVAHKLPPELEALAHTVDGRLSMAVRHRSARVLGLQFHPESILTTHGGLLMDAIIAWAS